MADTKLSPMQEQLLQRADAIFSSISNTVAKATDFAGEQIPDIALQYVMFGRMYSTALVLGSIVFIIGYMIFLYKNRKSLNEDDGHTLPPLLIITTVFGLAGSMIASLVALMSFKEFVLVWAAPKIWLITEIVKLVK
jgi:hypothetical protein